jgi:23S rRNA pseudouridine955/2504/2580 synthase
MYLFALPNGSISSDSFGGRVSTLTIRDFTRSIFGGSFLGICHGELQKDSGEWNDDLTRYDNDREVVEKARTLYKVLDKNSICSLVEMKPITGRKHQLRKQLYSVGCPIYGDQKYKFSNTDKAINKNLMLHSYQIKFMINDKKYTYTALLPDYFKKLLKTKRLRFPNS